MGKIKLHNIRVFTNHGCLEEEGKIGSEYSVDLTVKANLSPSAESDELKDTVDYVHLNQVVKEEMAIRSKLLEHVAERILKRIFKEDGIVSFAEVEVSKINPPLGGDVEKVTIILSKER
ncbi:dihydroneopterin aldolase [Mesonia ostreae]|uniref:7,8-dihydroneopterin aldolase n=1 Tax=Mesonia ostreae TaxID=861110 RepID=A0ABU2KJ38_9FLAO|nr:dihydroneopterin aldolase [Mesonia ostreae]MDT0294689.1 dihydroneopterin aldolase [Mesonia ostreae]